MTLLASLQTTRSRRCLAGSRGDWLAGGRGATGSGQRRDEETASERTSAVVLTAESGRW